MSAYDKLSPTINTVEELIHQATKPCSECGCNACHIVEHDNNIRLKCVNCGAERVL